MAARQGTPHLLIGDFNSLAPSDTFKASFLLRYLVRLDSERLNWEQSDGHPYLNFVVPPQLRFLNPLLRVIPRSTLLSTVFDTAAALYAPRGCITLLLQAGYVDCYRRSHPHAWGFTCPADAPAGRIDYIFADPLMTERLETCEVITTSEDIPGNLASDHLCVAASYTMNTIPLTYRIEEQVPESVQGGN
jgi:endonuclease/exonuclease/phosphatase family metal-dependent hydrolase